MKECYKRESTQECPQLLTLPTTWDILRDEQVQVKRQERVGLDARAATAMWRERRTV